MRYGSLAVVIAWLMAHGLVVALIQMAVSRFLGTRALRIATAVLSLIPLSLLAMANHDELNYDPAHDTMGGSVGASIGFLYLESALFALPLIVTWLLLEWKPRSG